MAEWRNFANPENRRRVVVRHVYITSTLIPTAEGVEMSLFLRDEQGRHAELLLNAHESAYIIDRVFRFYRGLNGGNADDEGTN